MSEHQHLPIFNTNRPSRDSTFRLFLYLPKELQIIIWRHALRRHRIVRLHLSYPSSQDPSTPIDQCKTTSLDRAYVLTTDVTQLYSKFLRVSRESRQECLRFYRSHIPCKLIQSLNDPSYINRSSVKGTFESDLMNIKTPDTFHFNPEWDFLQITCRPKAIDLLTHFIHDLKTYYDPKRVGLLNVIIDPRASSSCSLFDLDPSKMSPTIRSTVEQTLRQLHEVFVHRVISSKRIAAGGMDLELESLEGRFNSSLPISTHIPIFNRLSVDPRPISNDLKSQSMGGGYWQGLHTRFESLLLRFAISPARSTAQFKFMISYNPPNSLNIRNRKDAEEWLRTNCKKPATLKHQQTFKDRGQLREHEAVFGFWLFPVEAMKARSSEGDGQTWDMRMYAPQLGLSVMYSD